MALLANAAGAPPTAEPALPIQVDIAALTAERRATAQVPALAAAAMRNGRIVALAVADARDLPAEERLAADDVWHFGSNGKSITAVVAGRLAEKGIIALDATLAGALSGSDFEILDAYQPVTILDLLRHRGGIYNVPPTALSDRLRRSDWSLPRQREAMLRDALAAPPVSEPKSRFTYSNAGYGVVAALLERAAGVDFETLVKREVYSPLGLDSAGVGYRFPTRHTDGFVTHLEVGGELLPMTAKDLVAEIGLNEFLTAAGGFYMSIRDWLSYCNEHVEGARGRGVLLEAETYRLLHQPPAGGSYAAGWDTIPSTSGARSLLLHNGGGIQMSYAYVDLKTGIVVIVLANALSERIHGRIKDFRTVVADRVLAEEE